MAHKELQSKISELEGIAIETIQSKKQKKYKPTNQTAHTTPRSKLQWSISSDSRKGRRKKK